MLGSMLVSMPCSELDLLSLADIMCVIGVWTVSL